METSTNGGTSSTVSVPLGTPGTPLGTGIGAEARPAPAVARQYQELANRDRGTGGESLADFLGYFSIGLGLAQLAMPGVMSRVCGIDGEDDTNRTVMRLLGAREVSHGLAILSKQQPEKAVWSRVVGDTLDLALLGKALANPNNNRGATLFATANVLMVTALDISCARQLSMQPDTQANAGADAGIIRTKRSITVSGSPAEVMAAFQAEETAPAFMKEGVETFDVRDGESLSFRSVAEREPSSRGTVTFTKAPGSYGTEVRLEYEYEPRFGKLGTKAQMLTRSEPGQQLQDDLREFKQMVEIGEVLLSDASKVKGMHAAMPDGQGATRSTRSDR